MLHIRIRNRLQLIATRLSLISSVCQCNPKQHYSFLSSLASIDLKQCYFVQDCTADLVPPSTSNNPATNYIFYNNLKVKYKIETSSCCRYDIDMETQILDKLLKV